MNLVKATFVLLITVLTISNAKEHPDLVEEIDGMLDAPYMKYNAGKASDSDGDDGMSEDTSSSKDEDAEMMETIDKSHGRDDGMGDDDDSDEKKTVEKSKIQDHSSQKKKINDEDDEMESENNEDDNIDEEEGDDKVKNDGKKSRTEKNKEHKDNDSGKPEEDKNESKVKDSPDAKAGFATSNRCGKRIISSKCIKGSAHYLGDKQDFDVSSEGPSPRKAPPSDTKQNEASSSGIDSSKTSDEKTSVEDSESEDESDEKTGKEVKDKEKIENKNADNKIQPEESKPAKNIKSNDKKLNPEENGNEKPATDKSSHDEVAAGFKAATKDNKRTNRDGEREDEESNDNKNGDANDKTEQLAAIKPSKDKNDSDKPDQTDDKKTNDKTDDPKSATKTDSDKYEDEQNAKSDESTNENINKDEKVKETPGTTTNEQPGNKGTENPTLAPIDNPDNKNTDTKKLANGTPAPTMNDQSGNDVGDSKSTSVDNTTNDDVKNAKQTTKSQNTEDKTTEKPQPTTNDAKASENAGNESTIETNSNTNEDSASEKQTTEKPATDKNETNPMTNENNDKSIKLVDEPATSVSKNKDNHQDGTSQTTEKPNSDENLNKDSSSPVKESDDNSDLKDSKTDQQTTESPKDLAKITKQPDQDNLDQSALKTTGKSDEEAIRPKSDDSAKGGKNNEKFGEEKENAPNSNGKIQNDDIQRKVEQLSMNIGVENNKKGETLGLIGVKGDNGGQSDMMKIISSTNGDETVKESTESPSSSQEGENEDSSEQSEGNASADQANVVNTLVGGPSGNEKAGRPNDGDIKDQNSQDDRLEITSNQNNDGSSQGKPGNLESLLKDLVPSGMLPNLPRGLGKLSEMSKVSFTYNVQANNDVTVTSEIKEPMKLFDGKLEISDGDLAFSYNDKEKEGQRWQFKAEGAWVNGEQEINVILESSKHDDHFTLTGKGDSLALHDYSSMFAEQDTFVKSGIKMHVFEEIMLSDIELYVVFKDFENIVSLVSGEVRVGDGTHPSRCQTFIEKFPKKEPVFSILLDFGEGSPLSVLTSVMSDKIADIQYVKELLDNNGLLKVANGGFGFAASSSEVQKLRLNVFGEGMLERELGSHISSGVTLTLPISFHSQNAIETHDVILKISNDHVSFFPTKGETVDLTKVFKTLSEFTRPKVSSLGYPDLGNVVLRELRYDLSKSVYKVLGYATSQFNIAPGMVYLNEARLEFRQEVPDEFATLGLYGSGSTNIGQAKLNMTLFTDTTAKELLINGEAHTVWTPDIASSFGVAVEMSDDVRRILDDNRMLNMNIENLRMFGTVKDGESGLVHFSGTSRPMSWNDAIQIEAVVFHDKLENKRRMTVGYLFEKLPLTYAIDAFSFNQFPTPRLLDNSRNTTLVLSPVNTESMFLNPAFNGLSFMRGLSLVGQFRLPDVCSLNTLCESAAQLLGTEKWYRVQGLVTTRGYTLAGYVDKDFNLAKGLKLTDNILEFTLGNYSYMSISTAMRLDENNLTFSGYVNFDPNGVRLRLFSDDVWSHPFPGKFLSFDRLQVDVPLVSGMPMDELLMTGQLNFGLSGSLYRIFAPAYLTFSPSKPKDVGFQATMANITLETITSALNFKSSLPGVLLDSRFPETLVARYTPNGKKDENLELYGKLDLLSRTLICKLRIDKNKRITAKTSHSKFPLILDDGLITVYADRHRTRLGPRAWFTITPESTKFKLHGFANFMGLGTNTDIDVSESGTEFSLKGNLFGVTKTVVSFMSPDSLSENGPYFASACLPDIIPQVTSQVNLLVAAAADQAERYVKQASANYNQATLFHKQALAEEHKNILMVDEGENDIEKDDREMFLAEERYNRTCVEEKCGKTCIGCTSWLKCCDHDVFGNCVKCPGWKPCCWHGKSPICKGKNHACRIMKQVAAENLQKIARRVYADKEKKRAKEKILWKSEYMKGKTQAVLDAARRALHLVNHDSKVGLGAAASIKRFGLERLVNIKSVCFHTTLKNLATSCITMRINSTFADEEGMQSLPYYGCLNRELVTKMSNHIAHFMFRDKQEAKAPLNQEEDKPKRGNRRSGNLFGKALEEEPVQLNTVSLGNAFMRRRRDSEGTDDEMEDRPFWLIRNNFQIHAPSMLQQRANVPRSPLKKKWQIPASKKGKCKVYRQLVEICKDMMGTVKKMFGSYEDGINKYHKRLTELQLGINTTLYDLEKQVMETPELRDRLPDIEMNLRTVGAGVTQWKMNCEADQEDQDKMAIQEWVTTMEGRIRKLGGQGVERFLSNLFRAFEGMFLGAETPRHSAQKVLDTLQAIREISATFHDIFGNKEITLDKANSRAEIVMTKLQQIRDAQIFCDE